MSLIEIVGVRVGDTRAPALPEFSAALGADASAAAAAEGDRGPMLASLVAAGRLVPDAGVVLFEGRDDPAALRRGVALVDTPMASEPAPSLPVSVVVREDLRFAGRPARRRDAAALLGGLGLERFAAVPLIDVPPTDRLHLLLSLAALRDGVRALVLTSPERHGGPAAGWRRLTAQFAARGLPVLVIGGAAVLDPVSVTDPRSDA